MGCFLRQAESCPPEAMSSAFGIGQNDRCDINSVWDIFTSPNPFGNYAVLYKETLGLTCPNSTSISQAFRRCIQLQHQFTINKHKSCSI